MSKLLKELERIEDELGIPLCVHDYNGELTVYRVAKETGEDRNEPIPQEALNEILAFLGKYFTPKSPIIISGKGLTLAEINKKQEAWNEHCDMFNICNG